MSPWRRMSNMIANQSLAREVDIQLPNKHLRRTSATQSRFHMLACMASDSLKTCFNR
jgi:hypothetical protein